MPLHPVGLLFKSFMCVEFALIRLYQKTKRTFNGRVLDKTVKMDSNRRRTVDVSLVRFITGFVHAQKLLMVLPNVNRHGTDMPNAKYVENGC